MRTFSLIVAGLIVIGPVAIACSYARFVWEPTSESDPPYYPIWTGRKQGWIDRSGRRIRFEPVPPANDPDRLAPFQDSDLFGYSRRGNVVIPPRYLDAGEFHEGRARVVLKGPCVPAGGGLCGGPVVLPRTAVPRSVPPLDVQSRRWRPSVPPCSYTFIDTLGEIARSTVFDDAADFSEGLAAVLIGKTWGYADKNLSVLIAPRFQMASAFSEGLAAVLGVDGFSYIDGAGSVIIAGPFESADEFHEGVAVVYGNQSAWYIDRTGQRAVPSVYAHAGRFFHGRANVQFIDGTLAYIDRAGRVLSRWKSC